MKGRSEHALPAVTWVVATVAVLGMLVSGCGLGAESQPHRIDPHSVPYGLLGPAGEGELASPRGVNVTLYFAGSSRLVPVARRIPSPPTLGEALAQLASGPTAAQSARGLQSPISAAVPFRLVGVHKGVATVDAPSSFANLGGKEQIVAAAQLVFTATAFPGVKAVVLLVNGSPVQVPTPGGLLSTGPLVRSSYASLAPF